MENIIFLKDKINFMGGNSTMAYVRPESYLYCYEIWYPQNTDSFQWILCSYHQNKQISLVWWLSCSPLLPGVASSNPDESN